MKVKCIRKHLPWKVAQYSSLLLIVFIVFPMFQVVFLSVSLEQNNQSLGCVRNKTVFFFESHNKNNSPFPFFSFIPFCLLFLFVFFSLPFFETLFFVTE